jgi:hypothetical protein
MEADAFLALLKEAGCPGDLPPRQIDDWLARILHVGERTARRWRLNGRASEAAMVALRALAARRG